MKYLFCDNPAEEYVYMIGVDNSCSPIGISEISHGTVNASFARPREIFERGLLMGAGGIIVIHNHVTGEVTPSAQDYIQSRHLQAASAIIGLPLIDHIIAGRNGYASVLSLLESTGAQAWRILQETSAITCSFAFRWLLFLFMNLKRGGFG